jgi:hypothetical protein
VICYTYQARWKYHWTRKYNSLYLLWQSQKNQDANNQTSYCPVWCHRRIVGVHYIVLDNFSSVYFHHHIPQWVCKHLHPLVDLVITSLANWSLILLMLCWCWW